MTIDKGYGIFKCPSELHHDINYQAIIKSTIIKCLLEEQPETEARNDLLNIIYIKINEEYMLASHRQSPCKDRFEEIERLLLSDIAILDQSLPLVEDLVPMATVVNQKALQSLSCKNVRSKQCLYTKTFKMRGNSPQINKLRQELTMLINQGGENSDKILRLENQIQLLVDEDLTKALQERKNFCIL